MTLNNKKNKPIVKQSLTAIAFLFLIILGAKINFNIDNLVDFTFQTLALGMGYYFLPRIWRVGTVIAYLVLGILGFEVFSQGAGWSYFISWPLGFFIGFVLSALINPNRTSWLGSLGYFIKIHLIIVASGILGIGIYSGSIHEVLEISMALFPGLIIKSLLGATIIWLLIIKIKFRLQ